MPIIRSAIKYIRVSQRKQAINRPVQSRMKTAVSQMRAKPNPESLHRAFIALDRAAKKKVIHRRKADRLKSRLSRLIPPKA